MIEFHETNKDDNQVKIEKDTHDEKKTTEIFTMKGLLDEASAAIKKDPFKITEGPSEKNGKEFVRKWLFHIAVVLVKNIPEKYGPKTIIDLFKEQGEGSKMESWNFLNLGLYPYNFEDIIDVIKNGGVFIQEDKDEKKSEYKGYPRVIFIKESPETRLIMRVTITPTRERVYVFTPVQEDNFLLDEIGRAHV